MRDDLTTLRELITAATAAGVSYGLCHRAAQALVNLADRPAPDPRKALTLDRGRRIEALRAQGRTPAQIRELLGLTVDQVKYACKVVCECHTIAGAGFSQSQKEPAPVDLKSSSIGIGAMPQSLPNVPHSRPTAPADVTPRDDGIGAGKTGGNFTPTTVENLQVAPGVSK